MAIRHRINPLVRPGCPGWTLCGIRRNFFRLSHCGGQVPYVLLTRAPVAGGSIAAPPLPLDLHVLGLSLAFILSQDQTLRCCLYLFSFFYFSKKAKTQTVLFRFVVLLSRAPLGRPRKRLVMTAVIHCGLGIDSEIIFMTLVLLPLFSIVNLSMCSALFSSPSRPAAKGFAKLAAFSEPAKFFFKNFYRPFQSRGLRRGLFLKSECKGRRFFINLQIFQTCLTVI